MYSPLTRKKAEELYSQGKSCAEICQILNVQIPPSTLAYWVRLIRLNPEIKKMRQTRSLTSLERARTAAVVARKTRAEESLELLRIKMSPIAQKIVAPETARLCLAMLFWAEGAKGGAFCFSNSSSKMITFYLNLLKYCYGLKTSDFRFTVQCRADQSVEELEEYWRLVINERDVLFYKAQVDPRTVGKPTKKSSYKGVLRVDCFNAKIHQELKMLIKLVSSQINVGP